MRYTTKDGDIRYIWTERQNPLENEYKQDLANQKLCQLEDIEEELGIDLITLFKALTQGVYTFNKNGKLIKGYAVMIYDNGSFDNYFRLTLPIVANCEEMKLTDYGKTWSLDKKDLTNE